MEEKVVHSLLGNTDISIGEMVNSTPSCLKVISRSGELLSMNPRGLFLIEADNLESVLGANVYDLVEESHKDKFRQFNETICDGQKGTLIFEMIGLKGTRRWIETYAAPYQLSNGEIAHIAITNDITEKILAEKEIQIQREALASSSRLASLGQFVGGVAHEINNPLTIIHGNLTLLKLKHEKGQLDDVELAPALSLVIETTERITTIIQNLKTFSRKSENLEFKVWSLKGIVEETLSLCKENFRLNDIEIKTAIDPSMVVYCEKVQISQVLMNLLNNSFDAIQGQKVKWISIQSSQIDGLQKLTVTDSGAGIPSEISDQMLTPFFTTKGVGKGTGLGLSLSCQIMDHHNGKLYFNNESPNTQFVIELPEYLPN